MTAQKTAAILTAAALTLAGCGGGAAYEPIPPDPYAGYDCEKMFAAMDHKVGEANLLYINYEDEDVASEIGTGVAAGAAGTALATSLVLTPLGWVLAGGLMVAGASSILDGLDPDELSNEEHRKLAAYEREYNEMRDRAIGMQCDYTAIPLWDVSPQAAARRRQ